MSAPVEFQSPGTSAPVTDIRRGVDACRSFGALLAAAVRGEELRALLDPGGPTLAPLLAAEMHPEVCAVLEGSYIDREPPQIRASSYVVARRGGNTRALARAPCGTRGDRGDGRRALRRGVGLR